MIELTQKNLQTQITKLFDKHIKQISYRFTSHQVSDTIILASQIASHLKKNDILVLNGILGAGKTVFMSGIAKYFSIEDQVCSPTFTIVNEYQIPDSITLIKQTNTNQIFHFDVYRIEDSSDFMDTIGTEYFSNGICIIEWGNIIQNILPKRTIYIDITKDEFDENIRYFKIWRDET